MTHYTREKKEEEENAGGGKEGDIGMTSNKRRENTGGGELHTAWVPPEFTSIVFRSVMCAKE